MIQGPYKNQGWRDRQSGVEGALLVLQATAVLGSGLVVGALWLVQEHYLRFGLIFGLGAALLYAFIRTRAPLFALLLVVLSVVAGAFASSP